MTDFTAEREAMVERQLKRRGIHDQGIIDAFLAVPREAFVSADWRIWPMATTRCRSRRARPFRSRYIVAMMIQEAGIGPGRQGARDRRRLGLCGGGHQPHRRRVIAIERLHELVEIARERMARLGYDNVEIVEGDGTRGWPTSAVRRDPGRRQRQPCPGGPGRPISAQEDGW